MFLLVAAGLSDRLDQLSALAEALEAMNPSAFNERSPVILDAIFQLGDLPLRHDFHPGLQKGPRRNPRQDVPSAAQQGVRRHSPSDHHATPREYRDSDRQQAQVPDYVHGRRKMRWPFFFLSGEQDDADLLQRFELKRMEWTRDPNAPAPFAHLPSGAILKLTSGKPTREGLNAALAVAAFSAFVGRQREGGRAGASSTRTLRTPREQIRRLLSQDARADILLSHDTIEPTPGLAPDPARAVSTTDAHPGRAVLRAMEALHARVLIHGHAAGEPEIRVNLIKSRSVPQVALPALRRDDEALVAALVNTGDREVSLWKISRGGDLVKGSSVRVPREAHSI